MVEKCNDREIRDEANFIAIGHTIIPRRQAAKGQETDNEEEKLILDTIEQFNQNLLDAVPLANKRGRNVLSCISWESQKTVGQGMSF